jgi:putative ABC transport system permease protein
MNLLQLVLKQMRQRSLSTWLTLLSILLGVALATAIMILRREGQNLFAQTDFGYDIIVGPPKGSPLQLTLNTVYHMDVSPGVIPHVLYEDMSRKTPPPPGRPDYRPYVRIAVPFMVGDSFSGRRIVGTSPQMFGFDDAGNPVEGAKFQYRRGMSYELAEGRAFRPRKFEAVVGADTARALKLRVYDDKFSEEENEKRGGAFRATHGLPSEKEKPDIHKPRWRIVGILKPTHTANDRVLFVPYISLYAIVEHEAGMIEQALLKANIDPSKIPPERIDEVLEKLGIDPARIPQSVQKRFKLGASGKPASRPATKEVRELMRDATVAPKEEHDDHAHDEHKDEHKDEEHKDEEHKEEAHHDEHEHEHEEDPYRLDENGDIIPDLPVEEWMLSAIIVQSRGYPDSGFQAERLRYNFRVIDDRATAVNPASVMREFFNTFLSGSTQVLLLISAFVTIVAAASIMTTIYNSVSARLREIAILRALGATRARILALICAEAVIVGLAGGVIGMIVGHLLAAFGSAYLRRAMGEGINWMRVGGEEWLYLAAVVLISFLAGLVPAMKAYRTPVATNLVSG